MSSGSQRIALGSFVEINFFFLFRKTIKTYFTRPFSLYEVIHEDGHRMSVMNLEAGIRKSPKTPQGPPDLPFFLFLGSYKAFSVPSLFSNVAAVI